MYFTIYKTTNLINGKIYIGKHQTENVNDSYIGSGKFLLKAIKIHGRENFSKEILFVFETEEEMNRKEREILTECFISDETNYNAGVGGEGGPQFKGRKHSEETKQKISKSNKGKEISALCRQKTAESNRTRIISDETRLKLSNLAKNRTIDEEQRLKISKTMKEYHLKKHEKFRGMSNDENVSG